MAYFTLARLGSRLGLQAEPELCHYSLFTNYMQRFLEFSELSPEPSQCEMPQYFRKFSHWALGVF